MDSGPVKLSQLKSVMTCSLVMGVFILISRYNFLLFHSFAEGYSIVIACCIFMIAWNSRAFLENNYIMFLGIAYLFTGLLDFIHMLGYSGMGVFADNGGGLATSLWIAARYLESVSLIAAPFFINRKVNGNYIFALFLALFSLIITSVFYLKIFPDCYIDGVGLTLFKKVSEYFICCILAGAAYHLYFHRASFEKSVYLLILCAILMSVIAELFFTFYIGLRDLSNFLGHMFKIVSYYLIYKAIIDTGLKNPYQLMFSQLAEKEKRYRDIFENIQAIKLVIDPEDGAIVEANNSAELFYGYSLEILKNMKISDIDTLPEKSVSSILKNKRLRDKPFLNFSHRLASGEIRHVEAYSAPVKLDEKTLLHVIIHDVTERRLAEDKLYKNEKMVSDILESVSDGFFSMDNRMTVTYFNTAAERLLSVDRSNLIGMDLFESIPELKGSVFEEKFHYCINEKEPVAFQTWFGGDPYKEWYDVRVYPFEEGISIYFQAVTEKKLLETRLQQAQRMESIGTLAGGIAHDFNNILSSIIGYAEVAIDEVDRGSELEDDLKEILTAGIRAKGLVSQILAFSRQSSDEIIPIRVDSIAKEVVKFIRSSIPATTDIKIDILSNNNYILGNPSQVHQIFMNLFTNAAHAIGDAGGILNVSLNDARIDSVDVENYPGLGVGEYIEISVTDTGSGISEKDRPHIFEPYFTTKNHEEGTGLGLAMVHGIVESYSGHISVLSEPGKGSTFTILLPATLIQEQETPVNAPEYTTGAEKILLIDDELPIVKLIKKILSNVGYNVTAQTDSLEALRIFKATPDAFDLVISDMTMPDLTGDELAKAMMDIRPDIPVILCTGYSKRLPPDPVKEFKVKALLKKPIIKKDLIDTVRDALDKAKEV